MWPWPSARRGGIRTQTRAASQSSGGRCGAACTGVVAHAVLSIEQQQPPPRAPQRAVVAGGVDRRRARVAHHLAPRGEPAERRVEVVVARQVVDGPCAECRALRRELVPQRRHIPAEVVKRRSEKCTENCAELRAENCANNCARRALVARLPEVGAAAHRVAEVHRERAAAGREGAELAQRRLARRRRVGDEQPVARGARVRRLRPLCARRGRLPVVRVAQQREAEEDAGRVVHRRRPEPQRRLLQPPPRRLAAHLAAAHPARQRVAWRAEVVAGAVPVLERRDAEQPEQHAAANGECTVVGPLERALLRRRRAVARVARAHGIAAGAPTASAAQREELAAERSRRGSRPRRPHELSSCRCCLVGRHEKEQPGRHESRPPAATARPGATRCIGHTVLVERRVLLLQLELLVRLHAKYRHASRAARAARAAAERSAAGSAAVREPRVLVPEPPALGATRAAGLRGARRRSLAAADAGRALPGRSGIGRRQLGGG